MRFLVFLLALLAGAASSALAQHPEHMSPRSNYLERCGGCHGVDGRAFAPTVPDLKDKVGWFLCDPAGRDYVSRLPNIVFSHLTDDELAAMMNYALFDLGGSSTPKSAKPFTGREMGEVRRRPWTVTDLEAHRAQVVRTLVAHCGAPDALATDYAIASGP
jgi:hypothetical protein